MNERKEIKISFIGDILCEKPMQKYAEKKGLYVFDEIFENTRLLFSQSDYVVGNLETVFAGAERGYTHELYSMNTPDEFADALSKSGINMVTTAMNHCLDRGIEGLCRTIEILDKNGIEHTGTYANKNEEHIFIKKLNGTKIAILNYTYGTNTHETGIILTDEQLWHLNLLKPQTYNLQTYVGIQKPNSFRKKISGLLSRCINPEWKMRIKKLLHMRYNYVRIDQLDKTELSEEYLFRIRNDIEKAKSKADFVVVCIHSGGQFNAEPGEFTQFIIHKLSEYGADAVIGNHPHVVQKCCFVNGMFTAFCLGNYSISPSSVYLLRELKPEYSIMTHLYLKNGKLNRIGFSVLKIIENKQHGLTVVPVDELKKRVGDTEKELLENDVTFIYNRFTQKTEKRVPVCREYFLDLH